MHIDWSAIAGAVVASVTIVGGIGGLALRPLRKSLDHRLADCQSLSTKTAELMTRTSVLESQLTGAEKKLDELKDLIKELAADVKEIVRSR